MSIRPDFEQVRPELTRLLVYARQAEDFNHHDWPHLKNREDYEDIYRRGGEEQSAYEEIYGDGRDCAVWMSGAFSAFNDVCRYPTLKAYVDSFDNSWVYQTGEIRLVIEKAKDVAKRIGNCPWAVREMIKLFESEVGILVAAKTVLATIKECDIYKREAGIKIIQPMKQEQGEWFKNLITLVVLLGLSIVAFHWLGFWLGLLMLAVIVFGAPLIVAYVQGSSKLSGANLSNIYKTGTRELVQFIRHLPRKHDDADPD